MPYNDVISRKIYEDILLEDDSENVNKNLKATMEAILKSKIEIYHNDELLFIIKPLWIELYYYLNNDNHKDLYCNHGKNADNKMRNDKLYFRSFKSLWKNRNRMDICLGNSNNYISILIKRCSVSYSKYNDLNNDEYLRDFTLVKLLLCRTNFPLEYDYYVYKLVDDDSKDYSISNCYRIGIYNSRKKNNINKVFASKKYAFYISELF